jgi:hypothetical protein
VILGSSPTVDDQYFFVFVTDLFFCCPDFSFMSLICLSRFISHPDFFFVFVINQSQKTKTKSNMQHTLSLFGTAILA